MRSITRTAVALATAASVVAGIAGVAGADSIITSSPGITVARGATGTVTIALVAQDDAADLVDGCNATTTAPVKINFQSSEPGIAAHPAAVDITGCDNPATASVENGQTASVTVKDDAPSEGVTTITAQLANGNDQGVTVCVATNPNGKCTSSSPGTVTGTSFTVTVEKVVVQETNTDPCANAQAPAAPTIDVSPTSPNGSAGWYTGSAPAVSVTAAHGTSTLWATGDPVGDFSATAPSIGEGTTTVWAKARSTCDLESTASSVTLRFDSRAPVISLVDVPASFYFGFAPEAAPSCTGVDAIPGSGLAGDCAVAGWNPAAAVGSHTVTGSQADVAGNVGTSDPQSYDVLAWTLSGFKAPVDMGVTNVVKGGSTVPLKFEVFAGETELTGTWVVDTFRAFRSDCVSAPSQTDEIENYTSGATVLRYDTSAGQFIQNWQVPKGANVCYVVVLTTDDGSTLTATFKTK